jgi:hypothetical protein
MAVARNRYTYTTPRKILHALLFLCSCAVLGLTAYRLKKTPNFRGSRRPVISELLTVSVLNVIWSPIAIWLLSSTRDTHANTTTSVTGRAARPLRHPRWIPEIVGDIIHAILWLVGAALLTNRFPTHGTRGSGLHAAILTAIIALSWVCFGLLTLIIILGLMHHASTYGAQIYDNSQVMSTTGMTTGTTHGTHGTTRDPTYPTTNNV